jgi:putative sterol carrier protein
MKEDLLFLSPDWVHEITKVVQGSIAKDKNLKKLTSGYSLNLAYVFTELPFELRELYSNGQQLVLFVQLDGGRVKKLWIRTELPDEKVDFTISSDYSVVNHIFQGKLNPATAFINRQLKVEPMSRVYRRPRFTAQSIVIANMLLKIAMQVPTKYADHDPNKIVIAPVAESI